MKNTMWVILSLMAMAVVPINCKECLTPSKPHLSQCDMFFKCLVLPSQTIVWIPSKCDRGLVYEPSLMICVLPADDWECSLGDAAKPTAAEEDDKNVYGVENLDYLQNEITNYHPQFYDSKNNIDLNSQPPKTDADEEYNEEPSILMISNDNEDAISSDESANEMPAETAYHIEDENNMESSGDGGDEPTAHSKSASITSLPIAISDNQASMANHLQRLSQLIQSMSNAQQNGNDSTYPKELTPNDLNNFLANYNIQAGLQHQVQPLFNSQKHDMSPDGKIPAERLREIIRLQNKIQKLNGHDEQIIPIEPIRFQDKVGVIPLQKKVQETPTKTIRLNGNGVSAAQIVVNRPEGSVLFSLPNQSPPFQPNVEPEKNYLSQDTLRAVLDLSKQLIASNSQQQQQQQLGYLQQPVYRPLFYNVPVQDYPIPIVSALSGTAQTDSKQKVADEPVDKMEKISSVKGVVDASSDDRTTVIHNHIPITIQTRKAIKPTKLPSEQQDPEQPPIITNSYGEKIEPIAHQPQQQASSIPYPPLNDQPLSTSVYQPSAPLSNPIYPQYQQYQQYPQYQQQPPPSHFSPYYPPIYPENPHLSEYNVNSYVNLNTPTYPTLRPNAAVGPKPNGYTTYPSSSYSNAIYAPMRRRPSGSADVPLDQSNKVRHDNTNINVNGADEEVDTFDDNTSQELDDLDATDENVTAELSSPTNQRPNSANSNVASNLESKQSLENHAAANNRPLSSSSFSGSSQLQSNRSPLNGQKHQKNDIVHYGSTYMSYQDYQQTVEPLLSKGGADTIEVLSCVTGARQPHSSDCSKYFVCNSATQKVLDYVCPHYTAFNQESRFCDAKTYAECKGTDSVARPAITVAANRRIQLAAEESETALANAQRVHNNALRNQQLTAQLNRQTEILINQQRLSIPRTPLPTVRPQPPSQHHHQQQRRPQSKPVATTASPITRPKAPLRRIIKCNEPTKVRDSLSVYNYFTCFRGADGKLKALKQTCPGGLVFCERMKVCTSRERC